MRIYFIRHGQSVGNAEGFIQGKLDLGLSTLGVLQSELLAERLSQIDFDVIYCSPLIRAQQTAECIVKYHPNIQLITSEKLTGRNYGDYQSIEYNTITGNNSKSLSLIYKKIDGIDGIESRDSIGDRAEDCMNEIITEHPDKKVLIITHNEVKASCIQHLFHPDMPNDYFNASMTILEYNNGERDFGTLNDISHLTRHKSID